MSNQYKPATSNRPIKVGRTDCPLAVFRSHPDFPNTLAPDVEGAWLSLNPAWPEETAKLILESLNPPCHTDWIMEALGGQTEEKNGLVANVIYVKPGQKEDR